MLSCTAFFRTITMYFIYRSVFPLAGREKKMPKIDTQIVRCKSFTFHSETVWLLRINFKDYFLQSNTHWTYAVSFLIATSGTLHPYSAQYTAHTHTHDNRFTSHLLVTWCWVNVVLFMPKDLVYETHETALPVCAYRILNNFRQMQIEKKRKKNMRIEATAHTHGTKTGDWWWSIFPFTGERKINISFRCGLRRPGHAADDWLLRCALLPPRKVRR